MSLTHKNITGSVIDSGIQTSVVSDLRDPLDNTRTVRFNLSAASNSTITTLRFPSTANRTITMPTGNATAVGTTTVQTLTNKTLTNPIISSIGSVSVPTSTETLVGIASTTTLSNKSLTHAVINGDGLGNTRLGSATYSTITGTDNTAIGSGAGQQLTSGSFNVLAGKDAGLNLTTGSENIICGSEAGRSLTTQNQQIYIGKHAGREITSATGSNIIAGTYTVDANTVTSINNSIFVGSNSGRYVSGSDNVGIGDRCFGGTAGATKTGTQNVAVGNNALAACDTASRNVCYGMDAGSTLTTGTDNVLIGRQTGINLSPALSNSTLILSNIPAGSVFGSDTIAIIHGTGTGTYNIGSGCVVIGYISNLVTIGDDELYISSNDQTGYSLRGNFLLNTLNLGQNNVVLEPNRNLIFSGAISGFTTISAPAIGATWDLTLPANAGVDGQYLTGGAWVTKTRPTRNVTVVTDATVTLTGVSDFVILDASVAVTLPLVSDFIGKTYTILQRSNNTSTVSISGSDFVRDTSTTSLSLTQNQVLTVISSGNNLYVTI